MTLECTSCGKATTLTEVDVSRIKSELVRSGPCASYIWNCACGRGQSVLRLKPERPQWNLAASHE
jgi:hypothetical protein